MHSDDEKTNSPNEDLPESIGAELSSGNTSDVETEEATKAGDGMPQSVDESDESTIDAYKLDSNANDAAAANTVKTAQEGESPADNQTGAEGNEAVNEMSTPQASSVHEWMRQHKKTIRIAAYTTVLVAIAAGAIVGYAIPYSKYTRAQELFDSKEYEQAGELYNELGNFMDAADKLNDVHRHQTYENAKNYLDSGDNYEAGKAFAQVRDLADATDLACTCANALVEAGKPNQAIEIYEALGDGHEDEIAHAKAVETMIDAETLIGNGDLQSASDTYQNVPDDTSCDGKTAGARKQQLSNALANLGAAGTFKGSSAHVKVTQLGSSGYYNYWESSDPWGAEIGVRPSMDENGNVTLHGSYSFWRYRNFSTVSAGLKTTNESGTFTCDVNPGSINIDGNTTLSFSDGAWHATYRMTDNSHDVFFTYNYEADFTFTK